MRLTDRWAAAPPNTPAGHSGHAIPKPLDEGVIENRAACPWRSVG
jgi:hypothetical protein